MKAVIIFLLHLVVFITLSNAFCNSESKNIEVKLKNDILCHYKKEERPKQLKVPIELNYVVISFNFEESKSQLEVQSRILHRWEDLRLKWDETKYDSIQMIHVSSDEIWIPQLYLNDSHHEYGLGTCHDTECLIKSSGQVGCRFPCLQYVSCDADYYDWPFDAHTCKAAFRTFLSMEDVEFDPNTLGGTILKNQNNEFKLSAINGSINLNDKSVVNFVFKLERFSGTLFKHVIVPGYVLIVLTLLILWIEPEDFWRITLCGVNIYLHFSLMDRIWWQFPSNDASKNVPRILKYMVFMLILSTLILIQSIYLRVSVIRNPVPPLWIRKVVTALDGNQALKYFIFSPLDKIEIIEEKVQENDENLESLRVDDIKEEEKIQGNKNVWILFYRLIDRSIFVIFAIFYKIYDGY